jgi:hypothetical protein
MPNTMCSVNLNKKKGFAEDFATLVPQKPQKTSIKRMKLLLVSILHGDKTIRVSFY